jgi:hypothetical protein
VRFNIPIRGCGCLGGVGAISGESGEVAGRHFYVEVDV